MASAKKKLNPIAKDTLKQKIYSELKSALMAGRFSPGEQLTIQYLADQLGTGIMPVRETVQRLVAEGALIYTPSRTIHVPQLTFEQFKEVTDIRLCLEGLAVEKAAANMSNDNLREIANLLKKLEQAVKKDIAEDMLQANIAFHFGIYKFSNASYLISLIEALWLRFGPLLIYPLRPETEGHKNFLKGISNHSKLIVAIRNKNPEQARSILDSIIHSSFNWYESHFDFSG